MGMRHGAPLRIRWSPFLGLFSPSYLWSGNFPIPFSPLCNGVGASTKGLLEWLKKTEKFENFFSFFFDVEMGMPDDFGRTTAYLLVKREFFSKGRSVSIRVRFKSVGGGGGNKIQRQSKIMRE